MKVSRGILALDLLTCSFYAELTYITLRRIYDKTHAFHEMAIKPTHVLTTNRIQTDKYPE